MTASAVRTLRIATRSSALALFQAEQVRSLLGAAGVPAELATYTTIGDRVLDRPLSQIGAKGLFTAELEEDLLAGRVDCCVHSLKDLPTADPPGLVLVARLEREDPRDALVLAPGIDAAGVASLPHGARVGTSSLRRRAQLLALRPDLDVVELRGNVPTRVGKVDRGEVQAAILAAAGLRRLGLGSRIAAYLSAPEWLPAAGQGAIAVQARADDAETLAILARLDHAPTSLAIRAERAFLAALEGGCQVPIGALLVGAGGDRTLHGLVADVTGGRVIRGSLAFDARDPEGTGRRLAADVVARGGDAVLRSLRSATAVPAPQPE